MKVLYKCKCVPHEVEVNVPDRLDGSHIAPWMNIVQHCLAYDHSTRSPECKETKMEYAKIYLPPDSNGIGVPPEE